MVSTGDDAWVTMPELELVVRTVSPFEWVRVDGRWEVQCDRCDARWRAEVPLLVDWMDRSGAQEQRRCADGLSCPQCDWRAGLQIPLLQYRRGDGVGLVIGLPPDSDRASDEAVIRDVLAVADPDRLGGAGDVATVRLAWWGSIWNRPLGPRLVGCMPLVLPEHEEETERWRVACAEALELPGVRDAVRELLEAADDAAALDVVRSRPELVSSRWQLTVETLLSHARELQIDEAARDAVSERGRLVRQTRLIGPDGAADASPGATDSFVALATSTKDPDERLAALEQLIASAELPRGGAVEVAARLALAEALHGRAQRERATGTRLLEVSRGAVELADSVLGPDHELTHRARLNLAVAVQERGDVERVLALKEAEAILAEVAPRAARTASPTTADVATNLATIAAQRPGSRADNPEEASELLHDARHIRALTAGDARRDELIALVDEAATLRSKVSGSLRANAARAVELIREAMAREEEWQVLSASERVLMQSNLANALTQLRQRTPDDAPAMEVAAAARATIAAVGTLHRENPVGINALANAGSILLELYGEGMAGADAEPALWEEAREALERAFAASGDAFAPHHPVTLRCAVNLASVYGTLLGDGVADAGRCAELFEYVIEHARPHEAEFTLVAASNLAQLRMGQGEWAAAAGAYEAAAAAHEQLLGEARTYATRLGEVVSAGDLAARRALALAQAGRATDAVRVLEENRARLGRAEQRAAVADESSAGSRAIVHVATSAIGTLGLIRLPGGRGTGFVTTLSSRVVKPLLQALLEAPDRVARRTRLDELAGVLTDEVVAPVSLAIDAADEEVDEIAVVACGALASCPLHCVPDHTGATWTDRFTVRYVITAAAAERRTEVVAARALAIVDPDGSLPFARAEGDALGGWAREVEEPPPDRPARRWLLSALPTASVVHLACHGELDAEDAMRSRFMLGPGSDVTVADLTEVETPSLGLVVAPACQSASASPDAPDELLGVGHALAHAGASVVIASLWDADDAATALVVARLYRELGQGEPPGRALGLAQRYVSGVTGRQLAQLSADRLAGDGGAAWLPYDLAIEFAALSAHPRHRASDASVFGHPAEWGALSCLEA